MKKADVFRPQCGTPIELVCDLSNSVVSKDLECFIKVTVQR